MEVANKRRRSAHDVESERGSPILTYLSKALKSTSQKLSFFLPSQSNNQQLLYVRVNAAV